MPNKTAIERFEWFLNEITSWRYPNASSLAEKFEISAKTAQRDINYIRDQLGKPVEYDPHKKGWFIPLSSEELLALLLARKLLRDCNMKVIEKELSKTMTKITNILTSSAVKADMIDQIFSMQLVEYSPAPDDTFRTVFNACIGRTKISFTYYSPGKDETTSRVIEPYHLLNYMGTWHVIGHCCLREGPRDFVLNRMSDLKSLNEKFGRERFDLTRYLQSAFGIFRGKDKYWVTLRFSPERKKWVKSQRWHRDQRMNERDDGSLDLTFPVAKFEEVKMEILKHGSAVEVMEPPELREAVEQEIAEMARLYQR